MSKIFRVLLLLKSIIVIPLSALLFSALMPAPGNILQVSVISAYSVGTIGIAEVIIDLILYNIIKIKINRLKVYSIIILNWVQVLLVITAIIYSLQ